MSTSDQFSKQDLWQFSEEFYRNLDVRDTCLMLQDEYELNVNLTLFLLWYSLNFGRIVSPSHIEHLLDLIHEPNEWVSDYRSFRRILWQNMSRSRLSVSHDVRESMLELELTLEAQVQAAIIDYANACLARDFDSDQIEDNAIELNFVASENLYTYFHLLYPGHDNRLYDAQKLLSTQLLSYRQHLQAA